MPERWVYIVERGLGDSTGDPQTEIVGVYSTAEAAEAAMLREAPHSGGVDRHRVDSDEVESVMWREWDAKARQSVTKRSGVEMASEDER